METNEYELKTSPDGRRHRRRNSYSAAMSEENAIVEPDELTRRRSIVARWNLQCNKKKLTCAQSHDSAGSSTSSTSSIHRRGTRSVTRTPSSSATSRSSSMNEMELPEVFLAHPEISERLDKAHSGVSKAMRGCTCRNDSLSSASARDSFSSYSIKRQDSAYSISTCQSILAPSSTRNSLITLNNSQDCKVHQQIRGTSGRISERRHSDQTFSRLRQNDQRRLSDQSLIREIIGGNVTAGPTIRSRCLTAIQRREQTKMPLVKCHCNNLVNISLIQQDQRDNVKSTLRAKRPSIARQDSEISIKSSRRESLGPVTPKMLRRRFSEQLILDGGLPNEPEFDDLMVGYDEDDPEESLTAANARKKVTLKRHYYPEGNWGYVVIVVAVIIHSICHGLQMGSGVLFLPAITRFDKKPSDAVTAVIGGEDVAPGEFTFAVRLELKGRVRSYLCGGTIISPRHILTAAHCFTNNTKTLVFSGIQNSSDNAIVTAAAKMIPHPNFQHSAAAYDIGILVLEKDLELGGSQNALSLPTETPPDNVYATFAGWGRILKRKSAHPKILQKISVLLRRCYVPRKIPIYLCAANENAAFCDGDSGSGLVRDGAVIGIASGGLCVGGSTDYYTSVYYHLDWINSIINETH